MTAKQEELVRKAERALRSARLVLDDGDAEGAANRAYYACFFLAQAALLGRGEEPKTHSGTHSRFSLNFISEGVVPASVGSILIDAFVARQRSDYNSATVADERAAADLVADAERFVAAVRGLL